MLDFELVKNTYLKLRASVIKYLEKFNEESYYYQPTNKSNATAWIVPHIVAFEKVMVVDRIQGYNFPLFIIQADVDKYKPAVDGFNFKREEMMTKVEAIELLQQAQEVSIEFIDNIINQSDDVIDVDPQIAFDRYLFNFSHETEHLGQMKYLLGTWKRTR